MRKKFKKRLIMPRGNTKKSKFRKLLFNISIIFIVIIIAIAAFDSQIGPVIRTIAEYQCQNISVLAINQAVIDELEKSPELNKNLLTLQKNSEGTVTNITVNTGELNEIKARLTNAVSNRLQQLENQKVSIPLGTLLNWQLVSGRGPDINLQIVPTSFVQSSTENKVETAGINQTQHSIVVHFTVEMSAILPGYSTNIIVENDVTISETVIVGEVPMFYSVA